MPTHTSSSYFIASTWLHSLCHDDLQKQKQFGEHKQTFNKMPLFSPQESDYTLTSKHYSPTKVERHCEQEK